MKSLFSKSLRLVEKLGAMLLSKTNMARRALLKTDARERKASEVERLDRLRNPNDYRGR